MKLCFRIEYNLVSELLVRNTRNKGTQQGWLFGIREPHFRRQCRQQSFFKDITYYLLIQFMEQSPFWEANRFSASQEIPRILWNPKAHYRIRTCPATCTYSEPARSSPYPQHPTSWRSVLILSSPLRLGVLSGLFPSGFPTETVYTPLLFLIRATCTVHLILLYLIRAILDEVYRSLCSSLCSFPHFLVISSLFSLGPRLFMWTFRNMIGFYSEELLGPHPIWRTATCRLSATAYSMYSQLPSTLKTATCRGDRDPLITDIKYYRN